MENVILLEKEKRAVSIVEDWKRKNRERVDLGGGLKKFQKTRENALKKECLERKHKPISKRAKYVWVHILTTTWNS